MFLTRAAGRNPILVLMVCIATVVLSQIALTRLPVDLFPNITVPAITVSTSYSGASPEDVERTVTYPIEQAMTRVAGVQQLNSTSRRGSSMVQVWFDWGADLNVAVDPHRMAATGLSLQDVDAAVRRYNALIPSGSLRNADIDFQLMVPTTLQDVAAIRRVVLTSRNGVPVYVADIAAVEDGAADQTQIVKVDGEPGITVSVARQPGANIVEVVDALRAAVPRLTGLPEGVTLRIAFDQSRYIRAAIQSLTHEAFTGALLTFMVILVFLPNLWNLFIVGIGLPLSVATALILLSFTGQTLNVFTLGGLTLALGRLVDDAIVVRENITRHLARPGTSVLQAVLDATQEVGTAVFASTATTIAVFFPVVFLTGVARRLFVPMALTIVFAMAASYLVSMTIDPVLSIRFLRARKTDDEEKKRQGTVGRMMAPLERSSERMLNRLDAAYQRILESALQRRRWVLVGITILFAVSMYAARYIGSEFFPATDESQFSITVQEPQGTAVQITSAAAEEVAGIVQQVIPRQSITTITTNAGVPAGGIGFGANQGPNFAQVSVRLVPPTQRDASTDELAARVRRALDGKFPGVQFFVSIGGLQRNIVNIGAAAPIDVQVLGYDQTVAQQLAAQVAGAVSMTQGTADVRINPRGQYPAFTVRIDTDKAALLGLSPTAVASAINLAMSGNAGTASQLIDPYTGAQYGIVQRLDRLSWPAGFTYYMAGQTEQQQGAFGSLGLAGALALMLVYMIMASQFQSLVDPFVIMFTVPLGLIGVVWMLLLTHVTLSIVSFMGVITMVGIVVSNGILLVDYANRLQDSGLAPRDAVLRAGRIRLRPILMTALATILGMIPMALGLGEGSETNMPLARTVIGGLSVSTFLTLFLIPILYVMFERRGHRRDTVAG